MIIIILVCPGQKFGARFEKKNVNITLKYVNNKLVSEKSPGTDHYVNALVIPYIKTFSFHIFLMGFCLTVEKCRNLSIILMEKRTFFPTPWRRVQLLFHSSDTKITLRELNIYMTLLVFQLPLTWQQYLPVNCSQTITLNNFYDLKLSVSFMGKTKLPCNNIVRKRKILQNIRLELVGI